MKPARVLLVVAAFLPLVALFAWQASRTYWLCDDAYISFRYVRNFVEGRGLVFNAGERVEGYTNFLWVLELAGLWKFFAARPEIGCTILSAAYTAGTVVLTFLLAATGPIRERRWAVAWGALLLLTVSHTFVIWTTSGLETRQFTFFVALAVVCLRASADRTPVLVLASLALGAAEYTRPEANLLFLCCLAWLLFERRRARRLQVSEIAAFVVPFAVLVGGHFLWRRSYYGDLWPNTYYAKHVRGWPAAGWRYCTAAAIELGLYALVPAALVGLVERWRRGDATHLLALACIVPHAAYVFWIGGDHFEYRVFDFYWPFLSVAALEGLVALGRAWTSRRPALADAATCGLFLLLAACSTAVQTAKEIGSAGLATRQETHRLQVEITREKFPALFWIPGASLVFGAYNSANAYLAAHGVAAPYVEHRVFWIEQLARFEPYEVLHGTGWIPEDAVTWSDSIGVSSYYLADLIVIDNHGLTDRHIAHAPVDRTNDQRYMAHDRSADWPYLEQRGFNIVVWPCEHSAEAALGGANYAMKIRDDLWMPFDSYSTGWAERAFRRGPEVRAWRVAQDLGCFVDANLDGWTAEGEAFEVGPRPDDSRRLRLHPYRRCSSGMLLDSRGASPDRPLTGLVRSPPFRVPPEASLEFVFGGRGDRVGVRLEENANVLAEWHPRDTGGVTPEQHTLREYAGRELRLCVFDESGEAGGYVLVGEVVLLVPAVINPG
jgi:arabinofuranosyltransferase